MVTINQNGRIPEGMPEVMIDPRVLETPGTPTLPPTPPLLVSTVQRNVSYYDLQMKNHYVGEPGVIGVGGIYRSQKAPASLRSVCLEAGQRGRPGEAGRGRDVLAIQNS